MGLNLYQPKAPIPYLSSSYSSGFLEMCITDTTVKFAMHNFFRFKKTSRPSFKNTAWFIRLLKSFARKKSTPSPQKSRSKKVSSTRLNYHEAAEILVREAGVKEWRKTRRSLTGYAVWKTRSITTPPPTTLRRFLIVAHECKHIAVGRRSTMKSYEREFECVQAEEEACKRFGFVFPEKALQRNKRYVAYRLMQGLRRGLPPSKVKPKILRWCFEYLPAREKKLFQDRN